MPGVALAGEGAAHAGPRTAAGHPASCPWEQGLASQLALCTSGQTSRTLAL